MGLNPALVLLANLMSAQKKGHLKKTKCSEVLEADGGLPVLLGRKQEAEPTHRGRGLFLVPSWPPLAPNCAPPSPQPSDSSPSSSSTPASGCSSPNDSEHGPNPVLGSEVRPWQAGHPGASLGLSGPQPAARPGWGFSIWAAPTRASGGFWGKCARGWRSGTGDPCPAPMAGALGPAAAAAGDLSGPVRLAAHNHTGAARPCQGEWLRRPPPPQAPEISPPLLLHPAPRPSLSSPPGSSRQ